MSIIISFILAIVIIIAIIYIIYSEYFLENTSDYVTMLEFEHKIKETSLYSDKCVRSVWVDYDNEYNYYKIHLSVYNKSLSVIGAHLLHYYINTLKKNTGAFQVTQYIDSEKECLEFVFYYKKQCLKYKLKR